MTKKAAVVIGVNTTGGGLEPLHAAASAASEVADWLRGEGYEVKLLSDEAGPVHAFAVADALREFVQVPPAYQLLLVYFSGHGYWHARGDRWLLSGAPANGSDAINLNGAIDLARYSGIETVVFFSDTCRSIPQSAQGQRVEGIDGFPNKDEFTRPNKVDYFKATSEAREAFEIRAFSRAGADRWASVLTSAWLAAYREPTSEIIVNIDENGVPVAVVPNRKLETYLQPTVDEYLARVNPMLLQTLDINVPSADNVYMGRARGSPGAPVETSRPLAPPPPPSPPPPSPSPSPARSTAGNRAGVAITNVLEGGTRSTSLVDDSEIADDVRGFALPPSVDRFESGCGFTLTGATLTRVATTGGRLGSVIELLAEGNGSHNSPAIVRLWHVSPATSVAGQLGDGRCFVVPAFDGYLGHITVGEYGVTNVSYVPSVGTDRHRAYRERRDEIEALRALVATSIDSNTFVVRSVRHARRLADNIRMEKRFDPALGLYAAYAYSSAGLDEEVVDVLRYMLDDLNTAFFDVALLASRAVKFQHELVPFCPVLTQTWSLLRPRGWTVPEPLQEAMGGLLDSLWTTFDESVADRIFDAIEEERV